MIQLLIAVALALPGMARAQSLLSETFARPGLVAAPGVEPSNWNAETGQLLAKGGTGWSDSRVLRLLSRRADVKDASVAFELLTSGLDAGSPDDERPWDGVHVCLRYQDESAFYDVGVNRRDNTVVVKKKAPAPQGGSTFYTIGAPAPYPLPLNTWQSVRVLIADAPGGVGVKLYLDGALLLNVVDDGSQGGPPIARAGRVGLRGDNAALHLADLEVAGFDAEPAAGPSAGVLLASATIRPGVAQITWRTSEESDSAVDYGPTAAYGLVALGGFGRDHAVTLPGLAPGVYHYRARSRGLRSSAQGADATFAAGAPVGVAGSSPTVSLSAPGQGATLSGVTSVSASAADGAGQVFVKFLVDGAPLGAELAAPPFAIAFNTALVASGPHTISAVARNGSGLTSVATSSVTIANGATTHAAAAAAAATVGAINTAFTQPATAAAAGSASAAAPAGADGPAAPPAAVPSSAFAALSAAMSAADPARASERFLSPALADGINDLAHFGAQAVEVSIFDIRGRRVYHASRQGGALTWNGRDVCGRIVESGVYIARIVRSDGKSVYQSLAVAK